MGRALIESSEGDLFVVVSVANQISGVDVMSLTRTPLSTAQAQNSKGSYGELGPGVTQRAGAKVSMMNCRRDTCAANGARRRPLRLEAPLAQLNACSGVLKTVEVSNSYPHASHVQTSRTHRSFTCSDHEEATMAEPHCAQR